MADRVNTPPTLTKDYALVITHEVDFAAISDGAAHKIAATVQAAQRRAVDQALATRHTVVVRDFDLAERTGGSAPRFLNRATTGRRLANVRRMHDWLTEDVLPGILGAAMLSYGSVHANGWIVGCGVLATGWWLTDRIVDRVTRRLKRNDKL